MVHRYRSGNCYGTFIVFYVYIFVTHCFCLQLRSNYGSDFVLAKWDDELWDNLEKVLLAHKAGNLLGQVGRKMASGDVCGGAKAPTKRNANKGAWAPKGINLQHLHQLLGLTPVDIRFILRKVINCEYTLDQLASVAKERKEHYRVINAACEIVGVMNVTELVAKVPALNKAWFNDRVKSFKGLKKGEDLPETFIHDVSRELHLQERKEKLDGGLSISKSQPDENVQSDFVLSLNYKQSNLPQDGYDCTIVQDDVYQMTHVKPFNCTMVFADPNYGLFPGPL
jgi:hypothetical protein